ncbi:MAG: transglutaminase family protein [Rhodocyclales bacterium]|nr:transglutaminase family protein [Rhodocyclales bacterium]
MVRYRVEHTTRYEYGGSVILSQQLAHPSPRAWPWQKTLNACWQLEPEPSWRHRGFDAFDNPVEWFAYYLPHTELHVHLSLEVAVYAHRPPCLEGGIDVHTLRQRLSYQGTQPLPEDVGAQRYAFESPHIRIKRELAAYAAECCSPDVPVAQAAAALMHKIHKEFTFDPTATTVSTPVMEVLAQRRGVCQDFAHLMIACLRSQGIPARYMSGYLLTQPPPGQPRLIGADATHAWVAVYAPGVCGHDWIEFDPTNDLLPDTEHIAMAYGRDFSDVSPLRGIILGGGDHRPHVAVTVTPWSDFAEEGPDISG